MDLTSFFCLGWSKFGTFSSTNHFITPPWCWLFSYNRTSISDFSLTCYVLNRTIGHKILAAHSSVYYLPPSCHIISDLQHSHANANGASCFTFQSAFEVSVGFVHPETDRDCHFLYVSSLSLFIHLHSFLTSSFPNAQTCVSDNYCVIHRATECPDCFKPTKNKAVSTYGCVLVLLIKV